MTCSRGMRQRGTLRLKSYSHPVLAPSNLWWFFISFTFHSLTRKFWTCKFSNMYISSLFFPQIFCVISLILEYISPSTIPGPWANIFQYSVNNSSEMWCLPGQCTSSKVLDQFPLSRSPSSAHHSCSTSSTRQSSHRHLAPADPPGHKDYYYHTQANNH